MHQEDGGNGLWIRNMIPRWQEILDEKELWN
jgi:hypothetical protein